MAVIVVVQGMLSFHIEEKISFQLQNMVLHGSLFLSWSYSERKPILEVRTTPEGVDNVSQEEVSFNAIQVWKP